MTLTVNKPSLRFLFSGYSIWLEPEQFGADLDLVLQTASEELGVFPIPAPHLTVTYGMSHLSESEIVKRLRSIVKDLASWPTVEFKGFLSDIEMDGVRGGLMVGTVKTKFVSKIILSLLSHVNMIVVYALFLGHGLDGDHL